MNFVAQQKEKKQQEYTAYESAEEYCKNAYPMSRECMDLTNDSVDMKQCKQVISQFQQCFKNNKMRTLKQHRPVTDKQQQQ